MHIVYKIIINKLQDQNEVPYQYIGSKSNCEIVDGKIVDKRGSIYTTSSTNKEFKENMKIYGYTVELLYSSEDYEGTIEAENKYQLDNNVLYDKSYANKGIAGINIYTSPEYLTIQDENGLSMRIHRDDYNPNIHKGNTYGFRWYTNGVEDILSKTEIEGYTLGRIKGKNIGEDNGFFGKKHTDDTKDKIVESRRKTYEENPEKYKEAQQKWSDNIKKVSQLPKTEKFLDQLSERGKTSIYMIHLETLEEKRIDLTDLDEYKSNGWQQYSLYRRNENSKIAETIKCTYCDFTGLANSSNTKKWHFENCKHKPGVEDKWNTWVDYRESKCNTYLIYSKLDTLAELYYNSTNLSSKALNAKIASTIFKDIILDAKDLRTINKSIKKNKRRL